MSQKAELSVPETSGGERLDLFLARTRADLSRSRVQSLILADRVRVNGRPARASRRLRPGDRVSLDLPEPRVAALAPEDLPLAVVFEDDDLMVIDKPAGMVVHPGAGVSTGTLVHALLHRHPAIASVGGEGRPGIVHRLDRGTSGLLVVAKTAVAHRRLVESLRTRTVKRVYRALTWGEPRPAEGQLEAPIGRDPRERKRMAVVRRGGKPARTRWRTLEAFGVAAHLEVSLDTGRTHQIRVHLAHLHAPVVGDPVYGGPARLRLSHREAQRSLVTVLSRCLGRQALHAAELEFVHPVDGARLRFDSPLPDDFTRALELLRAFRAGSEH